MDRQVVKQVLVITTTATIKLECSCGGTFTKIYGKVDQKTNRNAYRCNRCKKEVYLDSNKSSSVKLESMSNRHVLSEQEIYIDKPYTCECGGMILYIGNNPGRCIKCNKTYEV